MSTNKSNTNSYSRQKWGRGSVSSSARRMSKQNNSSSSPSNNLVPNYNNHDNEGDTENIFDSIGRELDQCTADQNTNKDMVKEDNINKNDDDIDMFAEIGKELAEHTNTNDDNEVLEIPRPLEEDNNTEMDIEKLSIHSGVNNHQPKSNVDLEIPRELDIPVVPTVNNNNVPSSGIPQQIQLVDATQNVNTQTGAATTQQQQSNKKQKRGANSTVKKLSPPRHSFQSSTMKQKSTIKKKSTFKTPAGSKFPSRDLFSQRSTANKSVVNGTNNNVSTTQRKKRHSFRPSIAAATSNNTPAAPSSNVKDLRFVPTFLTNNSKTSPPKETVPIDDNDNDNDGDNKYSDRDVFAQNMVSTHHQAKQQARKSESSKSGYLVQRLRSLRNTEQRMAMKLRNSQLSSGLSGNGGGGIRKRRRTSAGNNHDPKTCASSILDVTVSGRQLSDVDVSLLGEGKSVLLAYIHQHTMTKQPSDDGNDGECREGGSRGVSSCYAWIVMSHDVMREQGLLDGSTTTKQLKIYDAVVIPPRVVDMKTGSMSSTADTNQTQCDMHRPTIVCTHISQAYPSDQPPLQDVSIDQFSS